MIKALLFDLDGTLLGLNQDEFVRAYLSALSKKVAPYVDPKILVKQIIASTEAMVRNTDPTRTNEEVFMEDFFKAIRVDPKVLLPVFDEFYRNEFTQLSSVTTRHPEARRMVEATLRLGLDAIVATNAVFPRIAMWERLRWAGVDDLAIKLVTAYEDMHACKPNPEYYQEILDRCNLKADECVMIGNDPLEDTAAGLLGIKTILVTDWLVPRNEKSFPADFVGTLAEVTELIESGLILEPEKWAQRSEKPEGSEGVPKPCFANT